MFQPNTRSGAVRPGSPVGVERRIAGAAADGKIGKRIAHGGRDRRRTQPRDANRTARIDEARERVGEHDRRIAQQPAPVAGVMRAVTGAQAQRS